MATTRFDKLVRDRIPEIIRSRGAVAVTRVLDAAEYRRALARKLMEEAAEFDAAADDDARKAELADVLEVLDAVAEAHGFRTDDLRAIQTEKRAERGGFRDRILLEETRDDA